MHTYKSEFSERYARPDMRALWSEEVKHIAFRNIWYALAKAQHPFGVISDLELDDIGNYRLPSEEELEKIKDIDRSIRHDVTAALRVYKEYAKIGGGKLHLGGTSRDVQDNRDMLTIRKASDIIETGVVSVLESWAPRIKEHANRPCISWTHYQPAGFITVGYRLANYAQDLLIGLKLLEDARSFMKGKGVKGIDGASAGYKMLLEGKGTPQEMEEIFLKELGLETFSVTTQIYPRVVDYIVLNTLASVAAVSSRFASNLRVLSSPPFGEMAKRPEETKVGSSDAPWKIYNQTNAERINALAAFIGMLPQTAWINVAADPLEGAVQDSANRRVIIPEGFLATDELLINYDYIVRNLEFWKGVERNVKNYGAFINLRELIIEAAKRGANRTDVHERLTSQYQFNAWQQFMATGNNPLPQMVREDELLLKYLHPEEIDGIMDPTKNPRKYVGDAPERTMSFLEKELYPVLDRYRELNRLGIHIDPEF